MRQVGHADDKKGMLCANFTQTFSPLAPPCWPSGKASFSTAAGLGFTLVFPVGLFPDRVICVFYLSVAARTMVLADPCQRYTNLSLRREATINTHTHAPPPPPPPHHTRTHARARARAHTHTHIRTHTHTHPAHTPHTHTNQNNKQNPNLLVLLARNAEEEEDRKHYH